MNRIHLGMLSSVDSIVEFRNTFATSVYGGHTESTYCPLDDNGDNILTYIMEIIF